MAQRQRVMARPTVMPMPPERIRRTSTHRSAGPSNSALAALIAADPAVAAHNDASEQEAAQAERAPLRGGFDAPVGQGGAALPATVRRSMEQATGVGLAGLRIHTDRQSGEFANALGADAVSHGGNVFFAPGQYSPGTSAGHAVLAHEIAHATRHETNDVHLKRTKRHLDFVRMKRNETHIVRMLGGKALRAMGADAAADSVDPETMDHYGHWWIETGNLSTADAWTPTNSYGWWPSQSVNIKQTLKIETVPGELNQGQAEDPHHGDHAGTEFHPVMEVDDSEDYATVRTRVLNDIDNFAHAFKGSWNWRLAWGKNCHTFQERMKSQLKLSYSKSKYWLRDPGAAAAELLGPWTILQGMGGMMNASPATFHPDMNVVTIDYMRALSTGQKQQIMDFIGASPLEMDDFCQFHWADEGKNIFT